MGSSLFSGMKAKPRGAWTIGDVESVCAQHGLRYTPPRGGGSHAKVQAPGSSITLTIPARRAIKPVYIRALVGLIEAPRNEPG